MMKKRIAGIVLAGLIAACTAFTAAANSGYDEVTLKSGSGTVVLTDNTIATVSGTVEITAEPTTSAIRIAEGSDVILMLEDNAVLTVTGGDAIGTTGGGAGIELPESSSLTICGRGTLNAIGGAAAKGENGQNGDSALIVEDDPAHDEDDWCYSGKGGNGGNGGGGAGAGIGGNGGNGGAGGAGGPGLSYEAEREAYSGCSGSIGKTGTAGTACGNVTVCGTVTLNAEGGSVPSGASAGGGCGNIYTDAWTYWYRVSGGGGGGAGGNGYAGADIGAGGSGGAGGGGGGSGALEYWWDGDDIGDYEGTGRGGAGGIGSTNGGNGGDRGPTHDTNHNITAGSGGASGASGFDGAEKQITTLQPVSVSAVQGLIYNGETQTGVQGGTGYTLSGDTSAVKAGTYTATATLIDGYCWSDGTLDAKEVEWIIAKQKVSVPEFRCLDYTGRRMTVYTDTELYTVANGKAAEIGTHTAVFTLRDTRDYEWEDAEYDGETDYEIHVFKDEDYNGKCDICEAYNANEIIYISTAAQFAKLISSSKTGNDYSGITVILTADIRSDYDCGISIFCGTFDGNGHTIECNGWTPFEKIENALIKDLTVSGTTNVGGIATDSFNSTIINCVNRSATNGGGIVDRAKGSTITGCVNYGAVNSDATRNIDVSGRTIDSPGGIAHEISDHNGVPSKISDCVNCGTVYSYGTHGTASGIADTLKGAVIISNCAVMGCVDSSYKNGIADTIMDESVTGLSNIYVGCAFIYHTNGVIYSISKSGANPLDNIFLPENLRNIDDDTPNSILQQATYIDDSDLSDVAQTLNIEANKHLDWYKWTVKDGALALAEPVCIYHAEKAADCNGGHLSYYEQDGKYYATGEFDSIIEDIDAWLETPVEDGGGYLSPVHIYEDGNDHCDICEFDILATDCNVTYLNKIINDDNTVTTKEAKLDRARMIGENDATWGTVDCTTWYVLDKNVTLQNRPEVKGNVSIVLKNGCTLTANYGITVEEGNSLAIYAQSDNEAVMGELIVNTDSGNAGIGGKGGGTASGDVTFCGGSTTITTNNESCIGGGNGVNGSTYTHFKEFSGRYIDYGDNGGAGGNSGIVRFLGGNISLTSDTGTCVGGGTGGSGYGIPWGGVGGDGGAGGSVTEVYFYDGNIAMNTKGYCVGGGNGGNGGGYFTEWGPQGMVDTSYMFVGNGGNGGNGGSIYFYGGTHIFSSTETACLSGGKGGKKGLAWRGQWSTEGTRREDGSDGGNATVTISGTPEIKVGDDADSAEIAESYDGEHYLSVVYKPATYTVSAFASVTGGAYIDTGFIPTKDTRVVMDVSVNGGMEYWFGVWDNDYNKNAFALGNDDLYGGVYAGYGNQGGTDPGDTVPNGRHTVELNKNKVYVDGVERTSIVHSYSADGFPIQNTLYLFAQNRKGAAFIPDGQKITFHSCRIFEDDTLVHYYVPAVYSGNGEQLIYDAAEDEYLSYSGSGTVTSSGTQTFVNLLERTSIRISGTPGLRFAAYVSDENREASSSYGFLVARENDDLAENPAHLVFNDAHSAAGTNGFGVTYTSGEAYNKAEGIDKTYADDGTAFGLSDVEATFFTGVMQGIPQAYYAENLIARPYIVIGSVTLYGETYAKSLYANACAIRDADYAGLDEDGTAYIDSIISAVEN